MYIYIYIYIHVHLEVGALLLERVVDAAARPPRCITADLKKGKKKKRNRFHK